MGKSSDTDYAAELERVQLALVEAQVGAIAEGSRIVIVLEGRDAAGKDGTIARMIQHLSPRVTRVVALPKPSDREKGEWWFQRYVDRLPTAGELVIFNRSWYNRAGVEKVMGFSTPEQQANFLRDAPNFERMLVEDGVKLVKYWLDISKGEQAERLADRRSHPLKQLKVSPLDAVAQEKWDAYTEARDSMLLSTHTALAPWHCVRADHKKPARLALMRHFLTLIGVKPDKKPDSAVVFPFEAACLTDGRLER